MAKALLGKSEDDCATVHTPKGDRLWYVNKIDYKCPEWFTELEPKLNDHDQMSDEDDVLEEGAALSAEDLKKLEQSYLSTLVK